jgi:putative hydrolase of the HAD superfamily
MQAVTFDYWNTLMRIPPEAQWDRRVDAYTDVLIAEGHDLTRDDLETAFDAMRVLHEQAWIDNRQHGAAEAVADVLADLGVTPAPTVVDQLVELTVTHGRSEHVIPTDGIDEALATLAAGGLRIGIICDVGITGSPRLREHLEHHGLLHHFDHWSFSDEVGVYKPHGAIFAHALAGVGVDDPARAAHVGDLRRTDAGGARAAGMTSIRYRGVWEDPDADLPDADHVIDHHHELAALLLG